MKILLVSSFATELKYDEQGIAYICQYLRDRGYSVDMTACHSLKEFVNLVPNISKYDLIGYNSYNDSMKLIFDIIKWVKIQNPASLICLGGYTATYYFQELMEQNKYIDFIVRNEGEEAFFRLCRAIESNQQYSEVNGLVFRDGFTIKVNEVSHPIQLRAESAKDVLIDLPTATAAHISSSRGCFGNCSFCYSSNFFDKTGETKWRGKEPWQVVDQMTNIYKKYNKDQFFFDDSSFEDSLQGIKRLLEIFALLKERELPLSVSANFRASIYKRISKSELVRLKKSGLAGAFIGIEAFNIEDLKLYNKRTTLADNVKAIQFFRDVGIGVDIGFINFNPYTSISKLFSNAEYLNSTLLLGSLNIFSKLRAYKGTEIYKIIRGDNLLTSSFKNGKFSSDYKYMHSDITVFDEYIQALKGEIEEYRKFVHYFYMGLPQKLAHYYHVGEILGFNIIEPLEEFNEQYHNAVIHHNKTCYEWYMSLLRLLETGCWDYKKAEVITKDSGMFNETKIFVDRQNLNITKLNRSIMRRYESFPLSSMKMR